MTYFTYFFTDTICTKSICSLNDTLCSANEKINIVASGIIKSDKILGLSPENARILIPVLVTICIFIIGILVNLTIKKIERKSFLKSVKSVLLIWCRLLSNPIKQQSNGCRDFNNRLQKSSEMQPERFKFNVILTNKILSLQLRDQIDTIILNHRGKEDEKSKCLFNLINQIEFLELCQIELKSKYETYHQDSIKYMDEWNEAYRNLNSIYTSLRIDLQTNPSDPVYPFYSELASTFNLFVKTNPSGGDINIFKTQLFTPIIGICQKYAISNPDQQEIYTVSLAIQDLLIVIRKWDTNREGTGQLFNDFGNRIDTALKVLNDSIKKLENMRFKWLFMIN